MATAKTLEELQAPMTVTFQQLAAQLIKIGSKGTVCYATLDATLTGDFAVQTFNSALNLDITNATLKANVQQMFNKGTKKVILFKFKTDLDSVTGELSKLKFNYLVTDSDATADQTTVSLYAKEKKCFGVVYDVVADSIYVINCTNPSVTPVGKTAIDMTDYLPIVAGILAGLPYDRSASSVIFDDLEDVEAPTEMHDGEFILHNDEDDNITVIAPVNSLTTLGTNVTEDMKSICIAEGMKRFEEDIRTGFRTQQKGHYKNDYDSQFLFFSAINHGYIPKLVEYKIIDKNYVNIADVNIEKQRQMWLAKGKTEAEEWTDAQVRFMTFGKMIYPLVNAKFLDAIEGMEMVVNMA